MQRSVFSWNRFYSMPLVGIMRNISPADIAGILPVYVRSGLSTVEITVNSPGFAESVREAVASHGDRLNIGAGTVCSMEDLQIAVGAGAQFIVTPVVNPVVIAACREAGIPVFAGAFTPTEIFTAWHLGADVVKVFPAMVSGLEYIRAIREPMPRIRLLPTGGVDLDNCDAFLRAGVAGIGIGGKLFRRSYIQNKEWAALGEHFTCFAGKLKPFSR
jgi:2-dehydro-3-deoxyphosphogluconate aldolase/(4S)-4-hydroxy-2-oxoglutarate aldolase